MPGVFCRVPKGAFYVFPDVCDLCARSGGQAPDDVSLCRYLLEEAGVAAVPGSGFGSPGYIRFSYTLPEPRIEAAMDRVARAAASLVGTRKGPA
jgi:aspartate aminotransferase